MELRWRGLCPHSLQVWVTEGRHTPGPWQLCFPHLSTPPSRWLIVWLMRTVLKGRRGFTAMVTWALSSSASPGWGLQGLGWDPGWLLRAGLVVSLHLSFLSMAPCPCPYPNPSPLTLWKFEGLEFVLCFQGIKTGQCVEFNGTHRTCEIQGWCPVESSTVPV